MQKKTSDLLTEDRHRELDDLLSDMLMTVQDIPDIGTASNTSTIKSNKPSSSNKLHVPSGSRVVVGGNSRDLYDTASLRTLTPTPSESGNRELELQERELILSLSDQRQQQQSAEKMNHSYLYPQQARIETLSITSDTEDDQIPYHAREDSRPFTYGNIPLSGRTTPSASSGGTMLKTPSGLSSPSMVRKVIGAERKPAPRNEFEEMILERREKILNDKYSIGDTKPNGGVVYEKQWQSSSNGTPNGYHPELLKRSNTMDGSFGRSPTPSEG